MLYIGAGANWDVAVVRLDHAPSPDQGRANAELIALAPTLLTFALEVLGAAEETAPAGRNTSREGP